MSDFIQVNDFTSSTGRPFRDVELPAPFVNKKVRVVGMSAKEASAFSKSSGVVIEAGNVSSNSMPDDLLARLLSKTLCDENFNLLFTENDVEKINQQSAKLVLMLANMALELSGLSEDAKGTATKNSPTPDAALPTA